MIKHAKTMTISQKIPQINLSSHEANRLMERKRKLDDELQGKLLTELSEMIKKSNAYVKEMQVIVTIGNSNSNKNWIRWKRISNQETP
jgi:hypothetical protein